MAIKLKDMMKKPTYSAVLLDEESHDALLRACKNDIPPGWKLYAHHMTINPFGLIADKLIGKPVKMEITYFGRSDMACAVKVNILSGFEGKTNNAFPHVTVAVNPNGGKPKHSNDIADWAPVTHDLILTGTIQNL
jgi:hypothetical protein